MNRDILDLIVLTGLRESLLLLLTGVVAKVKLSLVAVSTAPSVQIS